MTGHDTPRKRLLARLDALGIEATTYDHEPIFTVDQGKHLKEGWPGAHSKNLFLKDKKGAMALVSARDETRINLNALANLLAMGRPSFGKPELMEEVLGVSPGSVTIFALGHEGARALAHVVLDAALLAEPLAYFHPLENNATTGIAPADLLRFIADCGFSPQIVDFTDPDAPVPLRRPDA